MRRSHDTLRLVLLLAVTIGLVPALGPPAWGTGPDPTDPEATTAAYVPDLNALLRQPQSELRDVAFRYADDYWALLRRYDAEGSAHRREKLRGFFRAWDAALRRLDFESFGVEERIDWLLLRNDITHRLRHLDRDEGIRTETAPLLPFAETIIGFHEARRRIEPVDAEAAAAALVALEEVVGKTRKALERGLGDETEGDGEERLETTKTLAHRAARLAEGLRETLSAWYGHYNGYDPLFTWWTKEPYEKADAALEGYVDFLRQKIVGEKEGEDAPIVGDPVGREALLDELALAMIAYTPEELLAIGEREFAWCEAEMRKAGRELGYDDWHAALEHVKTLHVGPGRQPELIRDLALEAIAFLEARNLVTIPALAKDVWRLEMMSPEDQKMTPFFTGGEVIRVAFPTDAMTDEQKRMSLRGNNVHFARATVHHELFPGHGLQFFMVDRYHFHRQLLGTPFWWEGYALYWEMRLWDLDFAQSPENRIGMLFWRMHRAARIIFSLRFHLGEMTPQEAIDFLVERVGHERENAAAEVRRSFEGDYGTIYQLAYMIGGLQLMALHEELVVTGKMTEREFHDAVFHSGPIPIALVRARLHGHKLSRDFQSQWKFAGEIP